MCSREAPGGLDVSRCGHALQAAGAVVVWPGGVRRPSGEEYTAGGRIGYLGPIGGGPTRIGRRWRGITAGRFVAFR
ncbi:hypothetical protein NDU88_005466 [Pleurodeles waltl]|uniref:Uncharacterized protein n=1 Tax=Pleurodeles waltl TaxID=8319 RepID=A0AAV7L9I7_PLEWA|nr:hypothetical protein NDU88_005466 [Pleurodeles waltl]